MNPDIQHGGDLAELARRANCAPAELADFSVNLNPAGPPPGAFECYFRSFDALNRYPEPHAESLVRLIAAKLDRPAAEVIAGNGSNELLRLAPEAFAPPRALIVTPGYLEYARACEKAHVPAEELRLTRADGFRLDPAQLAAAVRPGDLVLLGNPNNPTGRLTPRAGLLPVIEANPQALFLIDEAFIDFVPETESLAAMRLPNLLVSRSLTKFYALPGLRMGFLTGPAPLIAKLRARQGVWSTATPAIEMAKFLLGLPPEWGENSRRETAKLRERFAAKLAALPGIAVHLSDANFLLLETDRPGLAERLLREHRIAVRCCANYPGLGPEYVRVAVRPEKEQDRLLNALAPKTFALPRRRTPALMLQGTCSNAGKSILTAAFCRILLQDGRRVAPFKAQNMALNSYVTPDGGEIGRAQAVQAEACRLDPDVRMNPILLKPESDLGSQVIVKGRAIGHMKVREYYANKPRLWETVKSCYDSLAAEYDAIVLEGAGSPGEVNLKANDIVNMNMAAHAGAKVLLAGDIDRGGVYASFLGTYATLTPAERELLAGFAVNKFRGDPSLLADAHSYLERATGKPVLGVVDWQPDLGLPEEDSVNFSFIRPAPKHDRTLDLALIQLGHIANFTDFVPFELEPDVTVRKIRHASELGEPDILVLPGSKSVAADLAMLDREGFRPLIRELVARGCYFVGICGGLQLAGREFLDPEKVESEVTRAEPLGLLDLVTVMRPAKRLCRTRAGEFSGYEIHHGETGSRDPAVTVRRAPDGSAIGFEKGRIFTSYLHGVFDDDAFRRRFLDRVRLGRGWRPLGGVTARYGTEEALNRLADHVRSRFDMKYIYQQMGLK